MPSSQKIFPALLRFLRRPSKKKQISITQEDDPEPRTFLDKYSTSTLISNSTAFSAHSMFSSLSGFGNGICIFLICHSFTLNASERACRFTGVLFLLRIVYLVELRKEVNNYTIPITASLQMMRRKKKILNKRYN